MFLVALTGSLVKIAHGQLISQRLAKASMYGFV